MCGSASPVAGDKEITMSPDSSPAKQSGANKIDIGDDKEEVTSSLVDKYVPDRDMTETPPPVLSGKRKRTGKRGKIGKKPADMPRRPLSGYNYFFSEQKSRILEEQAKKKDDKQDIFTTLGRIVADRWKKLGDKDKEKYNELAAKDLIRYRQEMEKYNEKIAMRNRKEAELKNSLKDLDDHSAARKRHAKASSVQSDQVGSFSSSRGDKPPPVSVAQEVPRQAQSAVALYASPIGHLSGLPALPSDYSGLLGPGLSLGGGLQGLPLFSQQMDLGRLALSQHQSLATRLDPTLGRTDLPHLLGQLPSNTAVSDAHMHMVLAQQQQQQQQQQAIRLSSFGSSSLDPGLLASRDAALLQGLNASAVGAQSSGNTGAASFLNNPSLTTQATDSETLRQTYARLLQRQQEEEEILRQLRQRGWPPGSGGGGF